MFPVRPVWAGPGLLPQSSSTLAAGRSLAEGKMASAFSPLAGLREIRFLALFDLLRWL